MALDISKVAQRLRAFQSNVPLSQMNLDPNKPCYSMKDPSPEFENGEIIEVCLECVKSDLIDPDQIYYEAVVMGRAWNGESNRWDWIVDLGHQFIKDTEGDGKRKNYRYQAMICYQDMIVKDKPLEFTNKLSLLGEWQEHNRV